MLKYKFLILIYLSILLFFVNNCSLIGFGVGTAIDNNKSGEHYTINEKLFDITPKTEIQLITVAKDTLSGFYINTTNEYSNEYITEYKNKYRNLKEQFIVPGIGDTLLISNPLGDIYKYIFLGFDYKKIFVKSTLSGKEKFMNFNSDLKIQLKDDQYINYSFINNGFEYKLIPIMSKLHLENKSENKSVFYHNIHSIQTNSISNTRYLIFAGIVIDIFLLYSIEKLPNPGGGEFKWRWE